MQNGPNALVASIPEWNFNLFVNANFVFVTASPKYFNFAITSNDLLTAFFINYRFRSALM